LGGGDELGPVVGFIAKTLVIGKDPPKLDLVAFALIDQYPDELCLDKLVVPLPGRPEALLEKRCDRRLEARIIATVGTTVVPAVDRFSFRGQ
jgi:hypothetical protein